MARAAALAVVVLLGLSALPARAGNGSIKLKRSIAGVALDDTEYEVRSRHGEPSRTEPSDLHFGWTRWIYSARRLSVTFTSAGRVWDVRTTAGRDRTRRGVGVGSSERTVRRKVPGVRCQAYGGPPRYRHWRTCTDTRTYRGPFTQFILVRGRVFRVKVAKGLAV